MKYFKIIILLVLSLLIFSCGAVKEGFSNQKKNSSDEFLVEKKSPLVMPQIIMNYQYRIQMKIIKKTMI